MSFEQNILTRTLTAASAAAVLTDGAVTLGRLRVLQLRLVEAFDVLQRFLVSDSRRIGQRVLLSRKAVT